MHLATGPAVGSALGLAQVALFAELTDEERQELAKRLRLRRYARGETLFLRGDPGTSLYVVQTGNVKICLTSAEGREVTLALFGPGEFFGELALLDGEPRSADAIAQEPSEVRLLQRDEFLRFIEERPQVAIALLRVLSHRLRRDAQIVEDAAFLDVPARLAIILLRLAETRGHATDAGVVIESRLTQGDLAGMAGTRRESINRWLKFYEEQKLIRFERGVITVLQPEGLRKRLY